MSASTRTLGRSGIEVGAIGFGAWAIGGPLYDGNGKAIGWGEVDDDESVAALRRALELGITFFDTADVYGAGHSERVIGRAFAGRRDEIVIATKFGHLFDAGRRISDGVDVSPEHIRRACRASLERLGTDHIDLYQLHRPDPEVPIADTLGALAEAVRAGLVREIGCSNFSAAQIAEAAAAVAPGAPRFVSVQNELSMLKRDDEKEVLPACREHGLAYLPYFPLFSGLLTGKYRKGQPLPEGTRITGNPRWEQHLTEANLDLIEDLVTFAAERGKELVDLAFAWLLAKPEVASVIAGATSAEQVRRNAQAGAWELTPEEVGAVDALLDEHASRGAGAKR